jgi:hypothetical protein
VVALVGLRVRLVSAHASDRELTFRCTRILPGVDSVAQALDPLTPAPNIIDDSRCARADLCVFKRPPARTCRDIARLPSIANMQTEAA